jgi:hypothetical protein
MYLYRTPRWGGSELQTKKIKLPVRFSKYTSEKRKLNFKNIDNLYDAGHNSFISATLHLKT